MLEPEEGVADSDYVNASYVDVSKDPSYTCLNFGSYHCRAWCSPRRTLWPRDPRRPPCRTSGEWSGRKKPPVLWWLPGLLTLSEWCAFSTGPRLKTERRCTVGWGSRWRWTSNSLTSWFEQFAWEKMARSERSFSFTTLSGHAIQILSATLFWNSGAECGKWWTNTRRHKMALLSFIASEF